MSRSREIRCFDYVNRAYDPVRAALTGDTLDVFRSATKAAAARAESVASELRVNLAGIEVGSDIEISINEIEEDSGDVTARPVTRIEIEWKAAKSPRLFPIMKADLSVYPLTPTETQLELIGHYQPPLGALGDALDAVVGHRIAEASVHRFVRDVAEYLRSTLGKTSSTA